jgi:hypothetical protein
MIDCVTSRQRRAPVGRRGLPLVVGMATLARTGRRDAASQQQ